MNERRQQIVSFINSQGAVSFRQLKAQFPSVSEMTLRNDLKGLDEERLIVRVHGGAKSVERIVGTDDFLMKRFCRNQEQKKIIAQKAVKLLLPGTSVFIDSGSTTTEFAKYFPDQSHLVVTSGIHCVLELSHLSMVQTFMLGGKVNTSSLSISGSHACDEIRSLNFDIAFLGVTGFMEETGFTCGSEEEMYLKKMILQKSDKKVLLMDSSKIGISNTFSFALPEDINVIVSDGNLPDTVIKYFSSKNIEIL